MVKKINLIAVTWTLAGICFLLSVLIDLEEKKQQKLKYEYLQEEFIVTRHKYFMLIDSNRSLTKKYSRLKTKVKKEKSTDSLVVQY